MSLTIELDVGSIKIDQLVKRTTGFATMRCINLRLTLTMTSGQGHLVRMVIVWTLHPTLTQTHTTDRLLYLAISAPDTHGLTDSDVISSMPAVLAAMM